MKQLPALQCCVMQELNQGRITITGTAVLVPDAETEAVKQYYLSHNPRSFWVNFGDFSWWRMEGLVGIRYISGFAPVGQVWPGPPNSVACNVAWSTPCIELMHCSLILGSPTAHAMKIAAYGRGL